MARSKQQGRKSKNKTDKSPLQDTTPTRYIDPNFGDKTCQGGEKSSLFWLKQIPEVFPDLHREVKIVFIKDMVSQAYASLHKRDHKEILLLLYNFSKDDKGVCQRIRQLQKAYIWTNKNFKCTCGSQIDPEVFEDIENVKISYESPIQDATPSKYIDPNFGDATCQGGGKSLLFWLKQIKEVFPDLPREDKIIFVKDMISQAYASLHDHHKEVWLLLFNLSNNDKGICKHVRHLKITYTKKNKEFKCTCGSEINPKVLEDIKNMEKQNGNSPPADNTTPSKYITYIDPNFEDETCQGGEKSSLFWLKKIQEMFLGLPRTEKIIFVKDMISQAYASLHKGDHKEILSLLYNFSKGDAGVGKRVGNLRKEYIKKNMNFKCTCGSEVNPEILEDLKNMEKDLVVPPEKRQKSWENIADPNFEDKTCEGADKSSLFWISKIAEEFSNNSNQKKIKFIENMKSQAHACLHKDNHEIIIAALKAGAGDATFLLKKFIPELKKEYDNVNKKFVCTCGLKLSDKVIESRKST